LLVEDNPVNQRVALAVLGKLGYQAELAANGAEAVTAVAARTYDLILMDCQMPVMDGFEATRRIREAQAGTRRVPILAMTANAMQGDRERCLQAGMDDYIPKPVTLDALRIALSRWLPVATATL
jgi:CheY-like chemotaxis protein